MTWNTYLVLLILEYLSMLYYIIRVADSGTLDKAFNSIENFLDINQE